MEPDKFLNRLRTGYYNINYNYEQDWQPDYFSKPVKKDPVQEELDRLDKLEIVVNMSNTQWVEEYCLKLQRP